MSEKTYLLEELLPQLAKGDKREVHFHWDTATKTWSVTLEGVILSAAEAAALIAAAKSLGMHDPESDQDQDQDEDRGLAPGR
ncbi:hypothetical protein ABXJ76_14605 [Methylobacter sp. G7]|uniref:hypothetical protein n=1 Tax=Methylobacter sp. G7 TaxID=3230117 RepID=UPI003D800A33